MCAGPDRIAAIRSESCHVVFDRYLSRLRRRMNSDCSPSWRTGFYGARDKDIKFLKNVYIMSQMRLICALYAPYMRLICVSCIAQTQARNDCGTHPYQKVQDHII